MQAIMFKKFETDKQAFKNLQYKFDTPQNPCK